MKISEEYFYLDEKTVMKALDVYMGLDEQLDVSDESWNGAAAVTKKEKEIEMYLRKSLTYRARKSGEEVQVWYDPSDGQLQGISFQGTGSRCTQFLEKLLPLLVQETYLTKDEIQEIVGDRTVSIVEVWPQEIYVMGSHFARGGSILYDMWELKAPEVIQEEMVDGDTTYEVVSLEALPDYAGDFILYGVLADTDSAFVEDSQLWNSLDAVKEGRVLSYEQVAFMHRDPITLNAQLDIFLEFFRSFKEEA